VILWVEPARVLIHGSLHFFSARSTQRYGRENLAIVDKRVWTC